MTVADLINKLQLLPPDAKVETEGCDCIGDAAGVVIETDGTVLITRHQRDQVRTSLLYPVTPNEIEIAEQNIEEAVDA